LIIAFSVDVDCEEVKEHVGLRTHDYRRIGIDGTASEMSISHGKIGCKIGLRFKRKNF
jgi:hypothetical protein